MNEDEVEYVAKELAREAGASWNPAKENSPVVKLVRNRFRDRARVLIAALDRHRMAQEAAAEAQQKHDETHQSQPEPASPEGTETTFRVGQAVMYRPPGDRRAVLCRIERIEGGQAYIVPVGGNDIGWVPFQDFGVELSVRQRH